MNRREFSAKTKAQAFERAGGLCEECTARLGPGNVHYDHRIPDALGGENTLDNCQCLCTACHSRKTTKEDVPNISRAKRVNRKHIGAVKAKKKMPYRRFDGTPVWPNGETE